MTPETPTNACDPHAALARLGDDRELYREVLLRFFDDSPASIARIDQAIAGSNGQELHRAAHSYKGLAAMAGAEQLASTSAELESLGRQSSFRDAGLLLSRMKAELENARMQLAPYYQ
jgi:HPt (histidine-containing phosphotransfer) domain-containing protein